MADNPIKYSDFIQPDGSVEQLIEQLEKLLTTYEGMLAKVKKSALDLAGAMKQVNNTTEEGRTTTRRAVTDAERLAREQEKLKNAKSDTAKEIARLRQEVTKQNRITKLQLQLNNSLEGSYNKLSAQYALNKIRLNEMSAAERSATKAGQALEKQTREIYEEMNRLQKATGKHQLQVGNYRLANASMIPVLGQVERGLMGVGTSIDALANADKPIIALKNAVVGFGQATLAFVLSPVGAALTALAAFFTLIIRNKDTVLEFEEDLIAVGKTTNITGEDLRELGEDIVLLSRRLQTVGVPALMEYAKVAGQLGVQGRMNILRFSEELAKLETATDIVGDQGAAGIARLLTLVDGGVETVSEFGDEITELGNNFAATEAEILTNATAIAQNTAQYRVGRQFVLAYGTATKAVGLEAEITGSTIGRTLGLMEKAIRTGRNIDNIARLVGTSVEELRTRFQEDAAGVFTDFITGLNAVETAGKSVNAELEQLGIVSVRDQRVISSLATAGFDTLSGAVDRVSDAVGALDEEFQRAQGSLRNRLKSIGIAWDNFILTIEDGNGVIAQMAGFFANEFRKAIERAITAIQILNAVSAGLSAVFREGIQTARDFVGAFRGLADIDIDPRRPLQSLKNIRDGLGDLVDDVKQEGRDLANAFGDAFRESFIKSKAVLDDTKQMAQDTNEILEQNITNGIKTIGQLDTEIQNLRDKLKGVSSREEAKALQDDIKSLEQQRNAILGVVDSSYKQLQQMAQERARLTVDVMAPGEGQDLARLQLEYDEKRRLFEKHNLDLTTLEEWYGQQRLAIRKKYADAEAALQEQSRQKAIQERQKQYKAAESLIDQEYDLRRSEIDIMQATEAEKTKLRLQAEKDRLQKVLALNKAGEQQLSNIQIQTIQNTITKIDQEMETAKKGDFDLYSALGLKLDDKQKQALAESFNYVMQNIQALVAARVEAADQALQKIQEEGNAIQERYNQEIEARNNGYANNVLSAQRELELNRKKEADALKEKQKAQKAQEAIDTAMQVTGLITASVEIWKALAGIPIVGPALASAAVGAMFASYAASKIKAKTLTKEEYGEGGIEFLQGGSHASGNDIPIGMTSSGKQRTAEGGEALAIINKRNTRKYKSILPDVIKSLNQGTFEENFSRSFLSSDGLPTTIFNTNFDSPDLRNIEDNLEAIRKRGDMQRYTNSRGQLVEVYKNIKRTYV